MRDLKIHRTVFLFPIAALLCGGNSFAADPLVNIEGPPGTYTTALQATVIAPEHDANATGLQLSVYNGDTAIGLNSYVNTNYYNSSAAYGIRSIVDNSQRSYGVYGYGHGEYESYGVYGTAHGPAAIGVYGMDIDSYGYGVYGRSGYYTGVAGEGLAYGLFGKSDSSYGVAVYGESAEGLAGYFAGDVVVTGACDPCNPSDAMFKKNVQSLSGGLAKIMALHPKSYEMKTDEFKDRIRLPRKTQYGLVAQDVEPVLPALVHVVSVASPLTAADRKNKVKKDPLTFKAMNYAELVPFLIGAMQEQQAQIEAMKAKIQQLEGGR